MDYIIDVIVDTVDNFIYGFGNLMARNAAIFASIPFGIFFC